jgi:hypothetical protein
VHARGDRAEFDDALREQRRRLEKSFLKGWVTPARGPVVFSEDDVARIEQVRDHGGWLNKQEHEYLQQLRAGGLLGDPLPGAPATRRPFIDGMADDFEVRIEGAGDSANVVIVFSHADHPGVRFGHRFPAPDEADGSEDIWLMEEVETGALGRLLGRHPSPDSDGIVWTDWA